jgi:hypothetical protein
MIFIGRPALEMTIGVMAAANSSTRPALQPAAWPCKPPLVSLITEAARAAVDGCRFCIHRFRSGWYILK